MKIEKEEFGDGAYCVDEMTYKGIPVYVTLAPFVKHPEKDVTGAAMILVGYLGKDVMWPDGRVSRAHVYERVWAPTWDLIIEAIVRCHDTLIAARDG